MDFQNENDDFIVSSILSQSTNGEAFGLSCTFSGVKKFSLVSDSSLRATQRIHSSYKPSEMKFLKWEKVQNVWQTLVEKKRIVKKQDDIRSLK